MSSTATGDDDWRKASNTAQYRLTVLRQRYPQLYDYLCRTPHPVLWYSPRGDPPPYPSMEPCRDIYALSLTSGVAMMYKSVTVHMRSQTNFPGMNFLHIIRVQ